MRCPSCGHEEVRVTGTDRVDGLVRRWRVCMGCGARWRTWEEWDGRETWRYDEGERSTAETAAAHPDQG
ncbi:hypothetical protein [Thermomonas hydrothermalis]|uniref:NrdR family transcriptional regulator n=1 Tax=Thermomonas hydrothermalis TaxID=213588 RepID=UPI003D0A520B